MIIAYINSILSHVRNRVNDSAPPCHVCAEMKQMENSMTGAVDRSKPKPMKLVMTTVEEIGVQDDGAFGSRAPVVDCSNSAYQVFSSFFAEHMQVYECMRLMLLDRAKRARGVLTIGQGGISETTADHRLIFAAALKTLSPSVIVAHNHPSGLLIPSAKDLAWTDRLKKVGDLHDIEVLDHLILGVDGYFSMADEGLL